MEHQDVKGKNKNWNKLVKQSSRICQFEKRGFKFNSVDPKWGTTSTKSLKLDDKPGLY